MKSGATWAGADPGVEIEGGHMASAEREPIMGVWGMCPQRGPETEPLVRGQGAKPPEAERFLVLSYVWNGAKLLCLWAVLWSLMVAAVPTCMRGSWVLIFHPWFGGHGPVAPLWIRPCLRATRWALPRISGLIFERQCVELLDWCGADRAGIPGYWRRDLHQHAGGGRRVGHHVRLQSETGRRRAREDPAQRQDVAPSPRRSQAVTCSPSFPDTSRRLSVVRLAVYLYVLALSRESVTRAACASLSLRIIVMWWRVSHWRSHLSYLLFISDMWLPSKLCREYFGDTVRRSLTYPSWLSSL